jgi:hypothetical protein
MLFSVIFFFRKLRFIGARCDVKTRAHQSKAACGSIERSGIPDATQPSFIVSVKSSIVRSLLISDSHLIVYGRMWSAPLPTRSGDWWLSRQRPTQCVASTISTVLKRAIDEWEVLELSTHFKKTLSCYVTTCSFPELCFFSLLLTYLTYSSALKMEVAGSSET